MTPSPPGLLEEQQLPQVEGTCSDPAPPLLRPMLWLGCWPISLLSPLMTQSRCVGRVWAQCQSGLDVDLALARIHSVCLK